MEITTARGFLTELHCELAFTNQGILLSRPISVDSRYDYIADINNQLYRIQCKTALPTETGFSIRCFTKNWNTKEIHMYNENEIDFFYTFFNDEDYLIAIKESKGQRNFTLNTVVSERNKNNTTVHMAENYSLTKQLLKLDYKIDSGFQSTILMPTEPKNYSTFCVDCGCPIARNSTRCISCDRKHRKELMEKELRIGREELKEVIRTEPFTKIGAQFNVTDNAVRKWCDSYGLPRTKDEINKYSDEEWRKL